MSDVRCWNEPATIPTYPLPEADRHPAFFEKRVYQGSSGKVYPLRFHSRVSDTKTDHAWDAWYLENEYVHVQLLPEIGGRVQRVLDRTNGYDLFYHQPVIKPALVGLAGPWISGGVEFNWPQHHRPSTYLPVDVAAESHEDGSHTVWLSEHDPMQHMKGMHGVCVRPGSSVVELKARLYNRTPYVQTFLWWANVAAEVHDRYQSFFPPDVTFVADHAARAMSSFPVANNHYYGVDYRPGTDLSWYRNIPVPTSYMVTQSNYEFFGGYDHAAEAGFVHVANRHISPGKKQWTWGNHDFGWAWDRELTDVRPDGTYPPYVELMAGVYTDNQPDFSYLHPYETKTFTQIWWPIQKIGVIHNANRDYALHVTVEKGRAKVGLCASTHEPETRLRVFAGDRVVYDESAPVAPDRPIQVEVSLPAGCPASEVQAEARRGGVTRLSYRVLPHRAPEELPPPASEPPSPREIDSQDELYLTGEHLEQYRHPTRSPEAYWEQALQRDPGDSRANTAMGQRLLKRGLIGQARRHLEAAVKRICFRHPNPIDGESLYLLGLACKQMGDHDEAYRRFYKATWNYAWRAPAYFQLACLDLMAGNTEMALQHLDEAEKTNADHSAARVARAVVLRKLGRYDQALHGLQEILATDPLDHWAGFELTRVLRAASREADASAEAEVWRERMRADAGTALDIAFDYVGLGCVSDALAVLKAVDTADQPMALYTRAYLLALMNQDEQAAAILQRTAVTEHHGNFPSRQQEEEVLGWVLSQARDPQAAWLLGNMLYDRRRYREATDTWLRGVEAQPSHTGILRNLGIAAYNIDRDTPAALVWYERAVASEPGDVQVLFEYDQLLKRHGASRDDRLERLRSKQDLIASRDDLTTEWIALLNETGRYKQAAEALSSRRFHPWEGGEGKVMAQHVAAHLGLGRIHLCEGRAEEALRAFRAADASPDNLGEAKHLLVNRAEIQLHLGLAYMGLSRKQDAVAVWEIAASSEGDFADMAVQSYSEASFYQALAQRALGLHDDARATLEGLISYGQHLAASPAKIDYFATSLPDLLIFQDDPEVRQAKQAELLQRLGRLGLDPDRPMEDLVDQAQQERVSRG